MITENTKGNKNQDHLNIIILSHSSIPDKADYILNHTKKTLPLLIRRCENPSKIRRKNDFNSLQPFVLLSHKSSKSNRHTYK